MTVVTAGRIGRSTPEIEAGNPPLRHRIGSDGAVVEDVGEPGADRMPASAATFGNRSTLPS